MGTAVARNKIFAYRFCCHSATTIDRVRQRLLGAAASIRAALLTEPLLRGRWQHRVVVAAVVILQALANMYSCSC